MKHEAMAIDVRTRIIYSALAIMTIIVSIGKDLTAQTNTSTVVKNIVHVMAEIGGLSIQIRESPIHGDAADETHSAWSVDLIGVSGRTCNLAWCTLRRWADTRVVYERHYDHQQTGGPLTGDDLSLSPGPALFGDHRPS